RVPARLPRMGTKLLSLALRGPRLRSYAPPPCLSVGTGPGLHLAAGDPRHRRGVSMPIPLRSDGTHRTSGDRARIGPKQKSSPAARADGKRALLRVERPSQHELRSGQLAKEGVLPRPEAVQPFLRSLRAESLGEEALARGPALHERAGRLAREGALGWRSGPKDGPCFLSRWRLGRLLVCNCRELRWCFRLE